MPENRTISYQEHYVQVTFFQSFIKDKQLEIEKLKKELNFAEQSKTNIEKKLNDQIKSLETQLINEINNRHYERP